MSILFIYIIKYYIIIYTFIIIIVVYNINM